MVALSRQLTYLFLTAILSLTGLWFFLSAQSRPLSPFIWHEEPPQRWDNYSTDPSHENQDQEGASDQTSLPPPVWLIATMSPAHSQRRRNIIRATWQTLYPDPAITFRFVIADPEELWVPLIEHENATYGDLIVLPDLEESARVANTIKTMRFFQYLAEHGPSWPWVSKMDDDAFLDVPGFYDKFLVPLLENPPSHLTLIGRPLMYGDPQYVYASGQLYTLSWDLVLTLARLYKKNPITDEHEDVLVGRLLHEEDQYFEFVRVDNWIAFDLDEKSEDQNAWAHKVMGGAINPHQLKDDETYLRVAAMFDVNGLVSD